MVGVAFQIMKAGKPAKAYLSTRRSGAAGKKMKKLKRQFHKAEHAMSKASMCMYMAMERAEKLDASSDQYLEQLVELDTQQTKASEDLLTLGEESLDAATKLVECALRENHGPETTEIIDGLTDKQIKQCVAIIETGAEPEDFFLCGDILPKLPFTMPDDVVPPGHSLPTGSPVKTSSAEQSA